MAASREELRHLVDEISDDQVPAAVEDLRRRTKPRRVSEDKAFSWIGMVKEANNGRTDNALRVDEILAEGFGRTGL